LANPYTTQTENGLQIKKNSSLFQWEVVKAVLEDKIATGTNNK